MKKFYLFLFTGFLFTVAKGQSPAQVTSISSGDWSSPATWNTGVVPICTDTVTIINTHTVSVTTAGNVSNAINVQNGATLSLSGGTLLIGCSMNNSTVTIDGILTISGGALTVNGGVNLFPASVFNMTAGILNIDPNNGIALGSYNDANGVFYINTPTLNVTGGNINLLDPPYTPGDKIIAFDTNTGDAAFGIGNTVTLGGGTHTNPANVSAFYIESNITGGTLEIGTLVVNSGRFSAQRHFSTNLTPGFITKVKNLTVNSGSETVINASVLAITGDIINNGFITSASPASAALSMVGNAFYSGGVAISPSAIAQSITGSGYFKNAVIDADPTAQTGNLIYAFTNYHSSLSPGLTLGMPLTVYGTLKLVDGKVNTTVTNFLALGTGISLPGYVTGLIATTGTLQNSRVSPPTTTATYPQGGWVTGPFKRYFLPVTTTNGNHGLMPVGSDTSRTAQILFTVAATTGGYLVSQWYDANGGTNGLPLIEPAVTPSEINRVVNGYWSVVNEGGAITAGTYTATFTNTRAQGILDYTKTTLLKRADAGSPWILQGSHVTTTGGNTRPTVKRTGLTGFSEFAIGANITVLPVTVEFFRGSKVAASHYLDWKVSCTNTPSVRLILERSGDGRNFTPLYDQTATALRCAQGFNYTDVTPPAGINYYRLKMISPDGESKYSVIVALLNRAKGFEVIGISPNPVQDNATLTVTTVKGGKMAVSVSDATGRLVMRQTISVIAGNNPVIINFAILGAGTYNISVMNTDNEIRSTRFVKY